MGNNYYFDQGEGDDYDNYPHIGKKHNGGFIFYKSRDYQINILQGMDPESLIVDEFGYKQTVQSFLEEILYRPYTEQDFKFF
jgi:hypothetical protein